MISNATKRKPINGGYYAKINEGFAGVREVNLRALLDFIRRKIA